MRVSRFLSILAVLTMTMAPASAVDLKKIDRAIAKEPAYKTKPTYCLLVFGVEAKTRVWLVVDGEVLHVDRNGNGDLTEPEERCQGTGGPTAARWSIGDILEADGKTRHTGLWVRFEGGAFVMALRTAERIHQEVGNEVGALRFSGRAKDAPIVQFAGPLTFLLRSPPKLVLGQEAHFIALIGTAGVGEGAAAYCHADDFEKLKMVGEVEFPRQAGAAALRVRCAHQGY